MLNRRYIRIKVLQAIYGFFQSDSLDLGKGERDLFNNIDRIYDLYIYQLALLIEFRHVASVITEDAKTKHLATKENLNPNLKFIENKFIKQLDENINLKREINNRKINWDNEFELVKKIFKNIKASDHYWKYMFVSDDSFTTHQNLIIDIFKVNIAEFELLNQYFEEKNLYWGDDIYVVNPMLLKTLESFSEDAAPDFALVSLYKDKEEDMNFVKELFCQTILKNNEIEKLIGDKTKNWEVDRIAMMDVLLMKMAISELMHFPGIPIKVTLNEYIEISKIYSTPKSNMFINGILDKLVTDLTEEKKIVKSGRGLMANDAKSINKNKRNED